MSKLYSVKLYTDGACSGNPGIGGWAYVLPHFSEEDSDYEKATTNNRMEITAVIKGLQAALNHLIVDKVEVITDSQYVVNTMTKGWQKKKNTDLWSELDELVNQFQEVTWTWVKGHADNKYNKRCDELAVAEYKRYQEYHKKEIEEEKQRELNWYGELMPVDLNQKIDIRFSPYEKYDVGKGHYVQILKCTALENVYAAEADNKELLAIGSYNMCRQTLQNYKQLVEDNFQTIPF